MTHFAPLADTLRRRLHDGLFGLVHGSRLIYNACWEDPRLDRQMLGIGRGSRIVVITSAGCNALDYLLDGPAAIRCVDMNPRQNAVLDLKLAVIRTQGFEDLFALFGQGATPRFQSIYDDARPALPAASAAYWDKHIRAFDPASLRGSFYFSGAAGDVAWFMSRVLLRVRKRLGGQALNLLEARTLDEQRAIYAQVEPQLWTRLVRWLVRRPGVMALLGVPRPQMEIIARSHPGGLAGYVQDKLRHVFTEIPIADNYFWRVYLTGSYTRECCPEYLKEANFPRLRELAGRVQTHTGTVSGFLADTAERFSHFVLLDHQDWLAWNAPEALREEWRLIQAKAAPGAKVLMRSAGPDLSFLPADIRRHARFLPEVTRRLHPKDRVGTYGSVHLAELA